MLMISRNPTTTPQERRRYDLAVTAVEYTRGDVRDAARILGYSAEDMMATLARARAARYPMPALVKSALFSARAQHRAAR